MRLRGPRPPNPMKLTRKAGLDARDARVRLTTTSTHTWTSSSTVTPCRASRHRDRHRQPGRHSAQGAPTARRLRRHRAPLRGTVHLAAAHPLRGRGAPHGGEGEPVQQPRRVLHEWAVRLDPEVRRRLLQAGGADHDLRRRQHRTRTIRGRSGSRTSGRSPSSSARRPAEIPSKLPVRLSSERWRRSRRTRSSVGRS